MATSGILQAATYGVSFALMNSISLLMLPYVSTELSPAQFGQLEVIASIAAFASVIVGLGLQESLFRHVGQASGERESIRIVRRIYALGCVMAMVALGAGYALAPWVAANLPGGIGAYEVSLVLTGLAFEGCVSIPLAWMRMRERALRFATLTLSRAGLQAALTVLMLEMDRGVAGVLEASLCAICLQTLILTRLQMRETGARFELQAYRSLLIYALPIVGSGLLAFCLNGLDRWLLAQWHGVETVAMYGVAAKFALAAVLLMQPFGMWWSPKRYTVLNGVDGPATAVRVINVGVVAVLAVAMTVGFGAPVLISLLMPQAYANAATLAVGLVGVMALRELAELLNIGCFVEQNTRRQLYANIFASLFGVGAMALFVPTYGAAGLIGTLLATHAARLTSLLVIGQRTIALPFPLRRYAIVAAVAAGLLTIANAPTDIVSASTHLAVSLAIITLLAFALKLLPVHIVHVTWPRRSAQGSVA